MNVIEHYDNMGYCPSCKYKKVLELIIEKEVNIGLLKYILEKYKMMHIAIWYNFYVFNPNRHLTDEEINTIKEVIL